MRWEGNFDIKVVTQTVPAYAIIVFKPPIGLYKDIQKAIASFWWGSNRNQRPVHCQSGKECVKLKVELDWDFNICLVSIKL